MAAAASPDFLTPVLVFCAAAVVAVPLARRAGLSAVIGYLVAGAAMGPFGLRFVTEPETVSGVAELGVVLLLFIVGLELKLTKLWTMRADIFGLGAAQLGITGVVIAGLIGAVGQRWEGAILLGLALSLSATSIALQMLEERGAMQEPYGRRTFAILLFQDMAIVPILALVPLFGAREGGAVLQPALLAIAALALVIVSGRYLLNPLFRWLAQSGAREVMTAAALLVVLGAAFVMHAVGLSMALGAFLAGVLLAESAFRHELEADIEPFRGLLLGLFFMSVGMGIDFNLLRTWWWALALALPALFIVKILLAGGLMAFTGSLKPDALKGAALLAPVGEFAFVLIPLTAATGLVTMQAGHFAMALAALSMVAGPLAVKLIDAVLARRRVVLPQADLAALADARGNILIVGFGRFGQLVTQVLLAQGCAVTVIDKNVEAVRNAARFGFKIYYGDGTRLDVLRAAGAAAARVIVLCTDDRAATLTMTDLIQAEFPLATLHARAYDRVHALALMNRKVDVVMRETTLSAIALGRETLLALGIDEDTADAVVEDVKARDQARLLAQQEAGMMAGRELLTTAPVPEPLSPPQSRARALNVEAEEAIGTPASKEP
ncbi:MAG: potassium transporter TrkA [Beijerinckiaceae bacterium]|nr:potassium transporter TrkA [Beijerinckiaceae bacterium]